CDGGFDGSNHRTSHPRMHHRTSHPRTHHRTAAPSHRRTETKMPLIAIAPCSKLPDYEESVRRAGGEVRVLNSTADSPADVMGAAQGLLLTGGGDVRPDLYGATAHPTFDPAEQGRDEYEIALVRLALEKAIAVCVVSPGVQLLIVARGGTLIQDIPDEVGTTVNHRVPMPPHSMAHDI